ncbi:MAG: DUF5668 domain-containing protein [Anaerolineaceae bacterium]|jgi:hypothetical protein
MRRSSLFWGIVIVLVGVLLLLQQLGLLVFNFWAIFWPLILILVGIWFLLGPAVFRRDFREEAVSIPLEGATEADIRIRHGAGSLRIGALANGSGLLSGTCVGGVDVAVHRHGERVKARLRTAHDVWFGFPGTLGGRGLAWDLKLSRSVALTLDLESGASESTLDLTDLKVSELEVQTGASSTEITLPAQAGYTRVAVKSGAAAVSLRLPEGVAGRIYIQSGLAGISVDTSRFPQVSGGYETPGYGTAANKADIRIETGVGSIDIR